MKPYGLVSKDSEFLDWLADKFVLTYNESENSSYVKKLRRMANELRIKERAKEEFENQSC